LEERRSRHEEPETGFYEMSPVVLITLKTYTCLRRRGLFGDTPLSTHHACLGAKRLRSLAKQHRGRVGQMCPNVTPWPGSSVRRSSFSIGRDVAFRYFVPEDWAMCSNIWLNMVCIIC
jgi:hypothetical protein